MRFPSSRAAVVVLMAAMGTACPRAPAVARSDAVTVADADADGGSGVGLRDAGNPGSDGGVGDAADAGVPACFPGFFRHAGRCLENTPPCHVDADCASAAYPRGCDAMRGRCRGWDVCACASDPDCPNGSRCITDQRVCGACVRAPQPCGPGATCRAGLECAHGVCVEPCTQDCACRVDKMAFTVATACQNDGSVEFCLPAADLPLRNWVAEVAPTVTCAAGRGRAGCDPATQVLCFFPTTPEDCTAHHGALKAHAWGELCQLASLPAVTRVVPTWFE